MDKPKPQRTTLIITEAEAGLRLDRLLKTRYPAVPFGGIQKLLRSGGIKLNGKKTKPAARVQLHDTLSLPTNVATQSRRGGVGAGQNLGGFQATKADLRALEHMVLHSDSALLVLNKPAGLAAQAGGGIVKSLDRLLAAAYPLKTPKLTHRLDRDTTGLLVCAKNRTAAAHVAAQFAAKTIRKTYVVVVVGQAPRQGDIQAPIVKNGPIAVVRADGDAAHTTFTKLASFRLDEQVFSVLAASPLTGRMNQLRVHFAHLGLPLVGDNKYGTPASKAAGKLLAPTSAVPLFLHAAQLLLSHPQTAEEMLFTAPLPPHFTALTSHVPAGTLRMFSTAENKT